MNLASFFFFFILILNLKHCISFAKHQHKTAAGISILPQTLLPSRLPHNLEQSSTWYAVGPVGYPFEI